MNAKIKFAIPILFLAVASLVLMLASCGGGGGSGSIASGDSGAVALYVTDAPTDDYESIFLSIKEVSLIPSDESQAPVLLFESNDPDGYYVDLLELRDQDMLFTVTDAVPSGVYDKIRLRIHDIEVVAKEGVAAC